jgi:hypothetical protein
LTVTSLPPTFTFSQAALQSYSDCRRQFWLAWLNRLPWPASQATPALENEQRLRMGARFHRLVERAELGVTGASHASEGLESPLREWFEAYLQHRPVGLPDEIKEVECTLSTPVDLGGGNRVRLAARYDLISAARGGRAVIVDWKTGERPSSREQLLLRMQSVVYPFVLVEASAGLSWGPIAPDSVQMIYWFAADPAASVLLAYDAAQHEANRRLLTRTLAEIVAHGDEDAFPMVLDTPQNRRRLCRYCIYRSRCDRGDAGSLTDLDEDERLSTETSIVLPNLDAVEELAF